MSENRERPLEAASSAGLIESLSDPDLDARRAAVDELATRGVEVLPDLVAELDSRDPRRRRWVVTAIGKMGESAASATPRLVELASDSNEKVANAAVRALRRLGPSAGGAGPVLVRKLDDRDSRHPAFLALVAVDPDAEVGVPLLVEGLIHRRFEVRSWAQRRLVALGDEVVDRLEELLEGEKRDRARREIRKVVGKMRHGA